MGQYYLGYVCRNGKQKVFDNKVDGDWNGLKLMEHSYWINGICGNVVNDLFYNKGQVCWVGDYYDEDDYSQVNCGKELVKAIGEYVWRDGNDRSYYTKTTRKKVRLLNHCLLVNHTKKELIVCDDYYEQNKWLEKWNNEVWTQCIHPLPLLTCSASHSGGSYYGTDFNACGTWFNDVIEVVLDWELTNLLDKGYKQVMYHFTEKR